MNCPKCGVLHPENSKLCIVCGTPLMQSPPAPAGYAQGFPVRGTNHPAPGLNPPPLYTPQPVPPRPPVYHTRPLPLPRVPSHTALAVISLCFSLICGVIAVIMASNVRHKCLMGDVEGAKHDSRKTLAWSLAGIALGAVLIVIIITNPQTSNVFVY